MLQSRDADEIFWPIDLRFRVTLAVGRSLLHDMVNIIPFLFRSHIALQLVEGFGAVKVGFDKCKVIVKL